MQANSATTSRQFFYNSARSNWDTVAWVHISRRTDNLCEPQSAIQDQQLYQIMITRIVLIFGWSYWNKSYGVLPKPFLLSNAYSPRITWPERDADHSNPSSAKVQNVRSYTSRLGGMVLKSRDKFTSAYFISVLTVPWYTMYVELLLQ
jgi:hypothetical protein